MSSGSPSTAPSKFSPSSRLNDDQRPRSALDAARTFTGGAPRTNLQRTTAVAAHRAAKDTADPAARHAAMAAGDAAAAAYLHPLPQPTQVGHILRSTAHAAHATELATADPTTATAFITMASQQASHPLVKVLRRYPHAPQGQTRVAELMVLIDISLRTEGARPHGHMSERLPPRPHQS